MRTAICAIAKNENRYALEWVNYHLLLGFDKVFLYDNNDVDGERLSDVVNGDSVDITDYRGRKYVQKWAYTRCYREHKNEFDWIAFIDLDEFIVLRNHTTIGEFLSQACFDTAKIVRLNWKHFGDGGMLDVVNGDYSVFNRFTTPVSYSKDNFGKSIIRTTLDLKDKQISAHGYCNEYNIDAVDCDGNKCFNTSCVVSKKPLYTSAWINHYRTKTIGEYVRQKYFRGDASSSKYDHKYDNLDFFFETSEKTQNKIDYAISLIENAIFK